MGGSKRVPLTTRLCAVQCDLATGVPWTHTRSCRGNTMRCKGAPKEQARASRGGQVQLPLSKQALPIAAVPDALSAVKGLPSALAPGRLPIHL